MLDKIYRDLLRIRREGKRCVLVSVIDKKGSGPSRVGAKMLVFEDGTYTGTIGGGSLERLALKRAMEVMDKRGHFIEQYNLSDNEKGGIVLSDMVCGGNVMLFYEYTGAGTPLFVFGTGNVGAEVAKIASSIEDFFVHVIEPRKEMLGGLTRRTKKHQLPYKEFFNSNVSFKDAFVFVSTPSHQTDFDVLKSIYSMKERPRYVGLLASMKKGKLLISMLKESLGDIDLSNLYTPAGLDIGGDTPFEIALSVMSEIQGIRNRRDNLPHRRMTWYL